MDRVGGFGDYLLLAEDARAFEDVLIAIAGEGEARRIAKLEREAGRGRG